MKLHRRLAVASVRTLAWSLAVIVVGVVALIRTAVGHEVLLDWVVEQVDRRVAGRIQVDGIRSGGIFRGAVLQGVRLQTPDGVTFVSADSLQASYSFRGLLSGDITLRDIRLWGAEFELAIARSDGRTNLERWLAPPRSRDGADAGVDVQEPDAEEAGGTGGGGRGIRLEDIRIFDSSFRLRVPMEPGASELLRVLPADRGQLALDLDIRNVEAPSIAIAPGTDTGTVIDVSSLSARLNLLTEPLEIQQLAAQVRIVPGRLDADVQQLVLPQVTGEGDVTVALGQSPARRVELDMDLSEVRGDQLRWAVDWAPPFTGTSRLQGWVGQGESRWFIQELDARWDGGEITGGGEVRIAGETYLEGLSLAVERLPVDAVRDYLPLAQGKPGRLSGNLVLEGPATNLAVAGRVGLRDSLGGLSVADVSGALLPREEGLVLSGFQVYFGDLNYRSLEPWVPALPVAGRGSALVRLNGEISQGLRVDLDLTHRTGDVPESRVLAQASFRQEGETWRVDVQGDASPFHLAALQDRYPGLPVRGAVTGSFRVNGPLDDLALRAELRQEAGRLTLQGALDPADWTRGVTVEGTAESFELGDYLVPAGDRTRLTGELRASVAGTGPEMEGEGSLRLVGSTIRGLPVDSILIRSVAADGELVVDTARASLGGFEVDGGGNLALPGVQRASGGVRVAFRSDSLSGVRPVLLGDVVHARDTLQPLDREILRLSGIDPDSLPLLEEVTLLGSASGSVALTGALDDFRGSGELLLDGVSYGGNYIRRAELEVEGTGLPGVDTRLLVSLDTDSLRLMDRSLAASRIRAVVNPQGARASAELVRSATESYDFAGGVTFGGETTRVDLDQLALRFDSLEYGLVAPTRLAWNAGQIVVEDLELTGSGPNPTWVRVDGALPRAGPADFSLDARNVALTRVRRILQLQDADWSGLVDLRVAVQGTGQDPVIDGTVSTLNLQVGEFATDSVQATLAYRSRDARVELGAWKDGVRIFQGGGSVPVDLALQQETQRILDKPMDLRASLAAVEVAPVLALLENLEDVEGTLTGEFAVRGTLDEPVPEGLLRLEGGAWTVGALGVRQRDVSGTFQLTPSGAVAVNAQARAGGRVDISGEVTLEPVQNPLLDLELRFQDFQGVDRRDVTGALSGVLQITGAYNRPEIRGDLTVNRGVLFLEEVQRAVGVVDLTDPLFLGLVEREAFAIPVDQPLLANIRNPFLDSLRMEVDLAVPRETWLRSRDMNVEIGGELLVSYDRPRRDLVLVGELAARRGTYTVLGLGKTFDVRGGTVSFIGIPGINPLLDIQAVAPIRRTEGGTLDITASVEGSLVDPQVTLSTEEAGLAQSDLVSYLIFGRPSSEITSAAAGSTGDQFTQTAGSTVITAGLGTLASQLGALAAQRSSFLDYLSVNQLGDLGVTGGGALDSFSSTQLELGWYLGSGDLFGVLVLRPLGGLSQVSSANPVDGARIEWQSSDEYHLEAFVEKRLLRRGAFATGFADDDSYAFGLAFFREWGY